MAAASELPSSICTVQHVTRASSAKLLSKFAEQQESDTDRPSAADRHRFGAAPRRSTSSKRVASGLGAREIRMSCESVKSGGCGSRAARRFSGGGGSSAECNSLLLQTHTSSASSRRSGFGFRRRPLGKRSSSSSSRVGPDLRHGITHILAALEMTWRRTVEGASRVFVEKHSSRHLLLIKNDSV